jgi:NitT/TauT family transport system substrate-binding protein
MQTTRRRVLSLAASAAAVPIFGARAQTPPAGPLRIGYVPVIGASALFVLDQAGWAREAGLALQLRRFDSGPAAIQALASGTLDVLAIGVAPVAVARAKGLDVSVITAAGLGGSAFIATPGLAEVLAADPDRAKAFATFKARNGRKAKLATLPPGGVPTVALNHWLFKTGRVDPADVEIVAMGIDAVQQALLSGSVDGGTALEPSATIVLARNPRFVRVINATDMFPAIPGVVIAATGNFLRTQPANVDKLVGLVKRATALIANEPDKAAPFVQAVLGAGLVEVDIIAKALKSPAVSFNADPHVIVEPTRAMLAYEVEIGDFATAPPVEGLFELAIYDRVKS